MAKEIQEFQAKITAKDEASKDIKEADKAGKAFDKSTYEAKLDTDDQATKDIATAEKAGEKFGGETFTAEVKVDTTQTEQGVGRVREQAEGAKSALANMIGNSAQDLGQLGGIAGSSGVAIGQLSEYMADAAGKGEGLGAVISGFAGPAGLATLAITALSVGLPILIEALTGVSDKEKIAKQTTEDLTKAFAGLDSSSSDVRFEAIAADIEKLLTDSPKLTGYLKNLGIGGADLAKVMTGGASPAIQRVRDDLSSLQSQLAAATKEQMNSTEARASGNDAAVAADRAEKQVAASLGITTQELRNRIAVEKTVTETIDGKVKGTQEAIDQDNILRDVTAELNDEVARQKAVNEATTKSLEDQAKEIIKGQAALAKLSRSWDEAGQSADSFNDVFSQQSEQMFDQHQAAADVTDDMTGLGKAVRDAGADFQKTGGHLTTFTEDGRTVLDSVQKLAGSIGTSLSAELRTAGGDFETVRAKAGSYRDELIAQMTQLGITSDEQQNYLEFLGLTPEQIETTIILSKQEEARRKISELNVDITNLPDEAKTEFLAAYNKGDFDAAYTVLSNTLTNNGKGVTTDAHANTAPAEGTMGTWRLNEAGQVVLIPVHANTAPADNSAAAFRRKEEADAIVIPVRTATTPTSRTGMTGIPSADGGSYLVGEAGPERVILPQGARVETAGRTMMNDRSSGGGGTTINYHITINAPPLSSPADVGQAAVSAIKAYERRSGRGWRAA